MTSLEPWSRLQFGQEWRTEEDEEREANARIRNRGAYAMRLAGASYPEIGEAYGVTGAEAYSWCEKAARERGHDSVAVARQLEADRLDHYLVSLHRRYAEAPDPKLMELLLRVMDRRARLLGLDAPTKVEAKVDVRDPMDVALQEVLREAREAEEQAEARRAE